MFSCGRKSRNKINQPSAVKVNTAVSPAPGTTLRPGAGHGGGI